jgi:hypothetical protein
MSRAPRLPLFLLLILLQALAPWVHAHAGTEAAGGLHLPGLEHLARQDGAASIRAETTDRIVALEAGIRPAAAPGRTSLSDCHALPPARLMALGPPPVLGHAAVPALPAGYRRAPFRPAQPRAPPWAPACL